MLRRVYEYRRSILRGLVTLKHRHRRWTPSVGVLVFVLLFVAPVAIAEETSRLVATLVVGATGGAEPVAERSAHPA